MNHDLVAPKHQCKQRGYQVPAIHIHIIFLSLYVFKNFSLILCLNVLMLFCLNKMGLKETFSNLPPLLVAGLFVENIDTKANIFTD